MPDIRNRLAATLLLAPAVALLVGLGLWQLERAQYKRDLYATFAAGDAQPLLTGSTEPYRLPAHRYRRLQLHGRFLPDKQILLDAMTRAGEPGYQVLTPFRPADGDRWLMVNRGWVAAGADRGRLPEIAVDGRERTIRGRIDALPRAGLKLGPSSGQDRSAAWPRVLLFPTVEELEEVLGVPLADFQLLLDAGEADGFVREWQLRTLPPERHVGYALQWFGLAIVLAAGAAGLLLAKPRATRHVGSPRPGPKP